MMSEESGPLESGSREARYLLMNSEGTILEHADGLQDARRRRADREDTPGVGALHVVREDRTVVPPDADADLWGVADLAALHEALTAACAILEGEADELDARRPHPPQYAFLDDVSEGLRLRADRAREVLESELETEGNSPGGVVLDPAEYSGQGTPRPTDRYGILTRVEMHLKAYLSRARNEGWDESAVRAVKSDIDQYREFKRSVRYSPSENTELETDGGGERVTGTITQIIPPEDHGKYATGSDAVVAGKHILTVDTRPPPDGLRWYLDALMEWLKDPTSGADDGVYHVLMDDCPYSEGDTFSGVLTRGELTFWTPVSREDPADGGGHRGES